MNKRKELVKELIREFDLKNTNDISSMFCEWMRDTIQKMLNSKLDEELGYDKYDQSKKKTKNSRNGFFEKCMRSEYGNIHIKVPRDCNSEFELQIVKKYQKTKSSYPSDDALLKSLYLAILDITKKWTGTPHNWMSIANQLMIYFEGRIVNDDRMV